MLKSTLFAITLRHTNYFMHELISIFANRLSKVKSATKYHLYGEFHQLSDLDLLLKHCDHLKQLFLHFWVGDQAIEETGLKSWMATNVVKSNSLQELKIY